MEDEKLKICTTFYHVVQNHPDDIVVSNVTHRKTGNTHIVFSIVDGDDLYPLGVLFSLNDDPFNIYDFGDDVIPEPKFINGEEKISWWQQLRDWWHR